MAKLPYFRWYAAEAEIDDDWRAMSMEERGLFMTLLNVSWMNDGLPAEEERIARIAGLPIEDFRRMWSGVSKKFVLRSDRLINERQEKDRLDVIEKSDKSARAAKARWGRNADALQEHCERSENAMPRAYDSESVSASESVSSVIPIRKEKKSIGHGHRFPEWWELWSGFMGTNHHGAAAQAWLSVVTPDLEDAVFECTRSYRDSRTGSGGYNPENFLFDQSRDSFRARWPPARAKPESKAEIRQRNFRDLVTDHLGERRGIEA